MTAPLLKVVSKRKPLPTNIQTMRKRARKYIGGGVLTSGYAPGRETVIKSLYEALATEIACVLRYGRDDFRAVTAKAAPSHAEYTGIVTRGAMNRERIKQGLMAEGNTLSSYRETADYRFEQDPTTRLLDEILAEEERMPGTLGSA